MLSRLLLFRLVLSGVLALGLGAGAAQACACRTAAHPVVRHIVYHPCHCHRVSLRRHRRSNVRVVTTVVVERSQVWRDDRAWRGAQLDERRWERLRPSPLHPWDTNSDGYLTWSGKPVFVAPVADRYAPGSPADCRCAPPPGYPQP